MADRLGRHPNQGNAIMNKPFNPTQTGLTNLCDYDDGNPATISVSGARPHTPVASNSNEAHARAASAIAPTGACDTCYDDGNPGTIAS